MLNHGITNIRTRITKPDIHSSSENRNNVYDFPAPTNNRLIARESVGFFTCSEAESSTGSVADRFNFKTPLYTNLEDAKSFLDDLIVRSTGNAILNFKEIIEKKIFEDVVLYGFSGDICFVYDEVVCRSEHERVVLEAAFKKEKGHFSRNKCIVQADCNDDLPSRLLAKSLGLITISMVCLLILRVTYWR